MDIIDFIIGLTLVNALPHFVLGVWNGRMLSLFGFGRIQNILYSLLNICISLGLFIGKFGFDRLLTHGIYLGGLFVIIMILPWVIFFIAGLNRVKKFNAAAMIAERW